MDEYLEGIVQASEAALAKGFTLEEVNARIKEATKGRGDFDSLKAVRKATDPANIEALKNLSAQGGSAVGDFFNLLASGASFGFADELIGALDPEKGEAFRERTEALKETSPKTAGAVQIAGGLLLPGAGAAGASRAAASRGAGAVLSGAVGGATAGAITGGIIGAGEAEGGLLERAKAGAKTGAIGGLLGAPLGAVGKSLLTAGRRLGGSRPGRIISALKEGSGIDRGIQELRERGDAVVERVREQFFKPLDRAFPEVKDPQILGFIKRMLRNDDAKAAITTTSRRVAKGERFPSFSDLQKIQSRLRSKGLRDEADELRQLMEEGIQGFRGANQAFREAKQVGESFDTGRKLFRKDAGDINFELKKLSDNPGAQEALREGMVAETISRIGKREKGATGILRDLIDPGVTTRDTVRKLFSEGPSGDKAFNKFLQVVQSEAEASAVFKAFRVLGGTLARFGGVGAGFGVANALFGGGNQ